LIYRMLPPKKIEILEYLGKYKFYRKVFQIKVVRFRKIYLLILSIWFLVASPKSGQGHINFFKWNTLLLISKSNSWCRELSKTLKENIFLLSTFWVIMLESYNTAGISITQMYHAEVARIYTSFVLRERCRMMIQPTKARSIGDPANQNEIDRWYKQPRQLYKMLKLRTIHWQWAIRS